LKEVVIGTEIFDRPAGYDPKIEPIVESKRGVCAPSWTISNKDRTDSAVRISIPKGAYRRSRDARNRRPSDPSPANMHSSSVDRLRFGSFIDRRDIGRLAAAGRWRANAGPAGNHYRDRVSDVNGDFYADFSPDNRQFAFARCATGSCNVMVMPVSGGRPRHIAADSVQGLKWSPDGRTIVFSSKRPGQDRLWRLAVSGSGEVQPIALAGDGALHPRFGRNAAVGPRLIFEHHIENSNVWRNQSLPCGSALLLAGGAIVLLKRSRQRVG
jgi:hypothetical protein